MSDLIPIDATAPKGLSGPTIVITEPTRASRRFEDNVTVIRIFNPDPVRQLAAIKYMLRWVAKEVQKEKEKDESNKMPAMQSQAGGV